MRDGRVLSRASGTRRDWLRLPNFFSKFPATTPILVICEFPTMLITTCQPQVSLLLAQYRSLQIYKKINTATVITTNYKLAYTLMNNNKLLSSYIYHKAELYNNRKDNSDWFPLRSDFALRTAKMDWSWINFEVMLFIHCIK